MPRFVVLYHETPATGERPSHWDLMFEEGAILRTWAASQPPVWQGSLELAALPDHRLAYLDYEGPLTHNRGSVKRVLSGTYEKVSSEDQKLVYQLHCDDACWLLHLKEAEQPGIWTAWFESEVK